MSSSEIYQLLLSALKNSAGAILNPGHFLSLAPLLVALLIAVTFVLFGVKRRAWRPHLSLKNLFFILFPRKIFLHPSAKTDYAVFFLNEGVLFFLTASIVLTPAVLSETILAVVGNQGHLVSGEETGIYGRVGATIFLVLVWDFAASYAHYLKHRIPVLWEFHKVHHCAEVLTPVTAMRRHPIDKLFSGFVIAICLGLALSAWSLVAASPMNPFTVFGLFAGVYLWRLLGYNLRHSHLWISYGKFWEQIFISPAQHQIHHSLEARHYHKNFGHIFAFWDRILGTLYVSDQHERVKFGVDQDDMPYQPSILNLYFQPFIKAGRLIAPKWRRTAL